MPKHHATPDEWAQQANWAQKQFSSSSCIVELLHRVEALEATQHAHVSGPAADARQLTLVERVVEAICEAPMGGRCEARAAIREVAEWLAQNGKGEAANLLDNEANR